MTGKGLKWLAPLALILLAQGASAQWDADPAHSPALPDEPRGLAPTACVSDPVGDTLNPGPDIVELCAFTDGDYLFVELSFADDIDPPGSGTPEEVVGAVEIDVDRDPDTGVSGGRTVRVFCPTAVPDFGSDAEVDLFSFDDATNTAEIISLPDDTLMGAAEVIYGDDTVNITIDLADLGSAGGIVNLATVIGNEADPTDCAPDGMFLTSSPLGEPPPEPTAVPGLNLFGLVLLALLLAVVGLARRRQFG